MTALSPIREEFLASFCFASEGEAEPEIARLSEFAAKLDASFRYWEIIYVLGEQSRTLVSQAASLLSQSKNLRIILVKDDANFYRRRAIAVSEAIGDVVVLTAFAEIDFIDAPSFAEQAYATGEVVLACMQARLSSVALLHGFMALVSPYRINNKDLLTIALPRLRLNTLLTRSTFTLDLRFEPKRGVEAYRRRLVPVEFRSMRRWAISDRYELLEELISTSSARMLRAYAALSAMVACLAFLYGLYAVGVLLFKTNVQEGWFSTAIVQSGSVGFIAIGMAVIGIGIADIAERLSGQSRYVIVDEIANISFFERTNEVNVELVASPQASPAQAKR